MPGLLADKAAAPQGRAPSHNSTAAPELPTFEAAPPSALYKADEHLTCVRSASRAAPKDITLMRTAVPRAPHRQHQRRRLRGPGARAGGLRAPPLRRLLSHL